MTDFDQEWARCEPWLAAAAGLSRNASIDDVKARVVAGRAQLWPAERAAAVTEIVRYDQRNVCRIWLAGGDLAQLQDMIRSAEAWARQNGCAAMEIIGRRGWQRALSGYQEQAVVLTKEIGS